LENLDDGGGIIRSWENIGCNITKCILYGRGAVVAFDTAFVASRLPLRCIFCDPVYFVSKVYALECRGIYFKIIRSVHCIQIVLFTSFVRTLYVYHFALYMRSVYECERECTKLASI
jgi:hypothetical protein